MDYSNNECMFEFTPDQRDVMDACWDVYRLGNDSREPIELTLGETSASLDLAPEERQIYVIQNVTRLVTCTTSGNPEGDVDLYLRMNEPPLFSQRRDLCSGTSVDNTESCSTRRFRSRIVAWFLERVFGRANFVTGTLYVGILAGSFRFVEGVQVVCN